MWDDHWEEFGRQKIKGNWGSFVTEEIRVSLPITRKVGFRWQSPENNSWVARLIKGNWGSFGTERIRVSPPIDRRVGFRWQNLEKVVWVARLVWRESLVG